ncbi:MAG TPA: GEVED domain-containing protein [Bacteroidia bacterium]|nr:GEVED domain-containing protein [Bacteroidia bacterium]
MKRKNTFKVSFNCLLLLLCNSIIAQNLITIPSSNPAGTGSTASPYRKPLGTNRAYERSAMLYTHAEIGQQGIINSLAFFVDSLNAPGDAITRIFIKEVADTVVNISTVAVAEAGATLVYDDTIFASQFILNDWITIPLTTSFTHASLNNILVVIETNSGGTAGTDINTISKGFRYFATSNNSFQYWQSATGSGTIPAGNGTANLNRPNIQFNMADLPPCTTPPNAGTIAMSEDSTCAGSIVNLSLVGADIGTGITYQWLTSNDGLSWNIISNETNPNFNPIINADAYFACEITCSGITDTTSAVFIYVKPFYNCYCVANLGGNCTSAIDSVSITGTSLQNGPSSCLTPYTAFPYTGVTTATLTQGQTYQLATKYNGNTRTSMWIDYNHNGVFDNNEWSQVCLTSTAGVEVLSNFTIPYAALTGVTGMRIRSRASNGANDTTTTCANFGTGEIEDYLIDINAAASCIAPPDAGLTVASEDSVCSGNVINLTLSASSAGAGISYQWIASNDGTNWSVIAGADQSTYNPLITSDSIFACIVTCNAQSDTSLFINITLNSWINCYCTASLGGNCTTTALDSIAIVGTTLANGPTGCAPTFYTAFPNAGSTTADLTQGISYNMITRYNGATRAACWIDYNHSGTFDNNEWTLITNNAAAAVNVNSNLQIPFSALTGITKMRIRTRATNGAIDSTLACSTFGSGETEDYFINIITAPNCVAPPDAGVTLASEDSVCLGNSVSLSLNSNSTGAGISYQWIASNDGVNWTNIPGANLSNFNTIITADSIFACIVTCNAQSDTSSFINITLNSWINCYCTNSLGGNCATTALDSIAIVGTTLANGPTGCAPTFYTAFTNAGSTTADLTQGQPYNVITLYNGATKAACWIDYNHSGTFDNDEWTLITNTSTAGVPVNSNLQIPFSALTGLTKMRIRTRATNGALDSTLACATFGSGETEDYFVNILAAPNCIAPPIAGNVIASQDSVCPGTVITYSLNGVSFGLGQTYQWISSNDGVNWVDVNGQTSTTLSALVNSDTLFTCVVTCSGMSDTSSYTSVFVNPFYNCYCKTNLGGNCATSAIDSVSITSTTLQNGPTGCATGFYTAFPFTGNTMTEISIGQTYELVTRFNGNVRASMWIDYDHNGLFDTYEWIQICDTSVADSNVLVNFTVPSGASTGLTGMRIRSRNFTGANDSTSACATFGSGEIEDYLVNIFPIVGFNTIDNNRSSHIYPNPSNGIFTLIAGNKINQVKVFDICGKELMVNLHHVNANQVEFNIEQKGVYLIQATDHINGVKTHKVIVN